MCLTLLLLALTLPAHPQWTLQPSPTTADLRGIHPLPNGIAWASGSNGTVLHTTDAGRHWLPCAVPPGAEHLDFRGIQAFDARTAIVMSSGKGPLSRLYKTTDACQTWALLFTNPDPEGFWDAYVVTRATGILLGDLVHNRIAIWRPNVDFIPAALEPIKHRPSARLGEGEFAASNSALFVDDAFFDF